MRSVLITGITGFVGKQLGRYLKTKGYYVTGTSRTEISMDYSQFSDEMKLVNLNDYDEIIAVLTIVKPNFIFHLAAESNVKRSWENPHKAFESNVLGTINLLNAVKDSHIKARVITIGSSEEYGYHPNMSFPINEDSLTNPLNPYGLSKLNVSYLAKQYYKAYDMDIIHARPFNHIGIGQKEGFVVPDFSSQIAKIELNMMEPIIKVGNLEARRDFIDVRDVINAYEKLMLEGKSGEIYNVCSSQAISIHAVLTSLISMSSAMIEVSIDPERMRPIDIPIYYGDNTKLINTVSWSINHSLEESLKLVLDEQREKYKKLV